MCALDLQGEDWELGCSDEELAGASAGAGEWTPEPAELEALYGALEAGGGILPLQWTCPGRRAPSPVRAAGRLPPPRAPSPHAAPDEKSDFDFMDEMSSLRLRVRREGEDTLRGSAKKKTTSFDGILSNMIRHKRIEQMEKDGAMSPGPGPTGTTPPATTPS